MLELAELSNEDLIGELKGLLRKNARLEAEWLVAARGKSKREIEQLIVERKPKPAVPPLVRKLPTRRPEVQTTPSPKPRAPKPEPLGLERFKVQFTADRELREKLAEAQDLLSHQIPPGDIAEIFGRALDLLIKEAKRVRFAQTDHPRCQSRSNGKPTRHIPAELRRQVAQRDEGRCTFVGTGGKRCPATDRLEFHHREPWARSREHSLKNLALLCHAHNQHAADLDFGREWMQQHRAGTSLTTLPGESSSERAGPVGGSGDLIPTQVFRAST